MIEIAPFPLALGIARPPALIAAAEKYFRDRALVFAVAAEGQAPYAMRDLVTGAIPTTLPATKAVGYTPLGVGLITDAANSGPVWGTPPAMPSTFANATMAWVGTPTASGAVGWMMTFGNSAGNPYLSIAYDGANGAFRYFENSYMSAANGSSPTGPVYAVVITKAGTAKKLYVNGVLLASASTGSATQTSGGVALGRIVASPGTIGPATNNLGALWSRTFSSDEVLDLSLSLLRSIARPRRFRPQYAPNVSGAVTGASSLALGLAGSIAATVLVTSSSSVPLPIGAAAAGAVLVSAATSQPLPVAGSAATTVLVQTSSSVPLPLVGTSAGSTGSGLTSGLALPLGWSASGLVLVQGASVKALPLAGPIVGSVLVQAASSRLLPLGGTVTGVVTGGVVFTFGTNGQFTAAASQEASFVADDVQAYFTPGN